MRSRRFTSLLSALAASITIGLLGAGAASAATVVNGDFETGTLSGWTVQTSPSGEDSTGSWFAYSGTTVPLPLPPEVPPVPPPPAGNFAALTAQEGPGARFLYQDVALEPYYSHQLTMLVYYTSDAPLLTPSPNSLVLDELALEENQQYRVDVIKPGAALTSLTPSDILATVFATKTGDPQSLGATSYTADLTPFAGQTVRLRLAEIDNRSYFFAGADSIAIQSTPPSNVIKIGKKKLNKKKGTAKVSVTLPGAGVLTAKKKKKIKPVTKTVTAAGTVKIALKPTSSALKKIEEKGKLKVKKIAFAFTPTGGTTATKKVTVVLKKNP